MTIFVFSSTVVLSTGAQRNGEIFLKGFIHKIYKVQRFLNCGRNDDYRIFVNGRPLDWSAAKWRDLSKKVLFIKLIMFKDSSAAVEMTIIVFSSTVVFSTGAQRNGEIFLKGFIHKIYKVQDSSAAEMTIFVFSSMVVLSTGAQRNGAIFLKRFYS